MSTSEYSVQRVDLSQERTAPERFDIAGRELFALHVPAPFQVRIGSPFADPITVSSPGRIARCDEWEIGSVYITNPAGAGVAELVYSDVLTLDFPTAGRSKGAPTLLMQLAPIRDGTSRRWVNGITGEWLANIGTSGSFSQHELDGMLLRALRLTEPDSTSSNHHGYPWAIPCLGIWEQYRELGRVPDIGIWRAECDVVVRKTETPPEDISRMVVGYASVGGSGSNQFHYGIYFGCHPDTLEWFAAVNSFDPDNPFGQGLDFVHMPLGVSALGPHRLAIDVGVEGGAPLIAWLIDGREVHRHGGALPGPIRVINIEHHNWIVGMHRKGAEAYHGFNGFQVWHWPGAK